MHFRSLRRLGNAALIAPALAVGTAAAPLGCEAQVLDPFPVENAGLSCTSHDDCPLPAGLCDRATGRCVECRDSDDCDGRRRDLCESTRGVCVECADHSHCEVGLRICRDDECIECMTDDDCTSGNERRCEVDRNRCRECVEDWHCGDGAHCDEDENRCESNSR